MFLSNRRIVWRALATAMMFLAAYSALSWMGTSATISGWIGLEKHQAEIPVLQKRATLWLYSALSLPFVSALLLGVGKQPPMPSIDREWFWSLAAYGKRLIIAVFGTLGFATLLFWIGWILFKLKPHA